MPEVSNFIKRILDIFYNANREYDAPGFCTITWMFFWEKKDIYLAVRSQGNRKQMGAHAMKRVASGRSSPEILAFSPCETLRR